MLLGRCVFDLMKVANEDILK